MTSDKEPDNAPKVASASSQKVERKSDPEWANGLRQLYDSVVEEPIPDSFKDLLSKLNSDNKGSG